MLITAGAHSETFMMYAQTRVEILTLPFHNNFFYHSSLQLLLIDPLFRYEQMAVDREKSILSE